MKRLLILTLLWTALATGSMAQTTKSEYIFDDFTEAIVIYKDGRQFAVRINYNLIDKQYFFYDQVEPDERKRFIDEKLVGAIKVDNRTFRITSKGEAEEILNAAPFLSVVYTARLKDAPKQAAYGGTSETSAIDSYKTIRHNGVNHNLEDKRMVIASITKTYHIQKDKKEKVVRSIKQFKNLYPKQKDKIEQYVEARQVDFNNPQQVANLFRYVNSLE